MHAEFIRVHFYHFIEKQAYAIRIDAEVDYKDPFESK